MVYEQQRKPQLLTSYRCGSLYLGQEPLHYGDSRFHVKIRYSFLRFSSQKKTKTDRDLHCDPQSLSRTSFEELQHTVAKQLL